MKRRDFLCCAAAGAAACAHSSLGAPLAASPTAATASSPPPPPPAWLAKRKILVMPSDDWGDCSIVPNADAYEALFRHPKLGKWLNETPAGMSLKRWLPCTLEDALHMRKLYDVLEKNKGGDHRPCVLQPNYVVGAPDYEAIAKADFKEFKDISIVEGRPSRWQREGFVEAAREGYQRGVFQPEYHQRLHHMSPTIWLETLRASDEVGQITRFLFSHQMYHWSPHVPEYQDMPIQEQYEWVRVGFERFRQLFGRIPHSVIASDAVPGTEEVWALLGLKVRDGKANMDNQDQLFGGPSSAKPDSTQDQNNKMGTYNKYLRMTYMNRNGNFEPMVRREEQTVDETIAESISVVERRWQAGQPAVIGYHRQNAAMLDPADSDKGIDALDRFLGQLLKRHPDMVSMGLCELAQLYRGGTSAMHYGHDIVCRNYSGQPRSISVPLPDGEAPREVRDLRADKVLRSDVVDGMLIFEAPEGDFIVETVRKS